MKIKHSVTFMVIMHKNSAGQIIYGAPLLLL